MQDADEKNELTVLPALLQKKRTERKDGRKKKKLVREFIGYKQLDQPEYIP